MSNQKNTNMDDPCRTPKFKAGDMVTWINGYGVKFPERRIERIDEDVQGGEFRYFIENSDTPWYSIRESKLIPDHEDVVLDVVGGHKIRSMLIEKDFTEMENDLSATVSEMFLVGLTQRAFKSIDAARQFASDNPAPGHAAIANADYPAP